MDYRIFSSAKDYRPVISQVAQLFDLVFRRPFPAEHWEQWYFNNPYGDPYVVLSYQDRQLVGHHALIPQTLVGDSGRTLQYFLSVSTMVHPRHRNLSFFIGMTEALHNEAGQSGADFILAFPNANSAPLFERIFRYRLLAQTDLCNCYLPSPPLSRNIEGFVDRPPETTRPGRWSYPLDSAYWIWRTKVNQAKIANIDGKLRIVYKIIGSAILMVLDVAFQRREGAVALLAGFAATLGLSTVRLTRYHASLLGIPDSELTSHDNYVVRCLGFPLAGELPDIRLSLLLSDVF
jgi:hypothetical protein